MPYSKRLAELEEKWDQTHGKARALPEASVKLLRKAGLATALERPRSVTSEKKELADVPFRVIVPRDTSAIDQPNIYDDKSDNTLAFVFVPKDRQEARRPKPRTKAEEHAPQTRLAFFPHVRCRHYFQRFPPPFSPVLRLVSRTYNQRSCAGGGFKIR